jgi:two-component sensor histidine kinase
MLLLNWGNYYAQDSIDTLKPFFRTYSLRDGLHSNHITFLFQDSKGLMWIGTEEGVSSFDGKDFKLYENKELNQSLVTCITEDKQGIIWVLTRRGNVFLIEQGKALAHPQNDNIIQTKTSINISDLVIDDEGGLNYFAGSKFWRATFDTLYETYSNKDSNNLLFRRVGDFIFSNITHENLSVSEPTFQFNDTVFTHSNQFNLTYPSLFSVATDSSFAIALQSDLILYENGIISHLKLSSNATNSLVYTKDGDLWIATENKGAFQIKGGKIISNIFPNEKIHTIREDFEGGLWFGMPSSGIRYVPNISINLLKKDETSEKVKSFFVDNDSNICWITEKSQLFKNGELISSLEQHMNRSTFQRGTLNENKSFCISYLTRNKRIPQLLCIDKRNMEIKLHDIDYLGAAQSLLIESGGDTLVIGYNDISNLSNKFTIPPPSYSKHLVFVRDIVEYRGAIWIASNFGIVKLTYHKNDKNFLHIHDVLADSVPWRKLLLVNKVFLGITRNGDWFRIDEETSALSGIEYLVNKPLNCFRIVRDRIYLGFRDGIACLKVSNESNNSPILDFQYLPIDVKQFSSAIFDLEVIKDTLFFACADGIFSVNLSELEDLSHPGKLSINDIKYNDSTITDLSKPLEFYSDDRISFDITAVRFRNAPDFNYQYRLLPTDTIWRESKQSELNLFQLPENDYELQVKLNDDVQQSVAFSISNYWYQQTWFIVVAAILATAIGFLPFYYRIRLHTVAEEIEREKNNLRISTLTTQLKPHFIFNALNSIQAYMLEQNTSQATSYLAKFAKHIRATLELSREDTIPLAVSLESLENYLVLEKMRKNGAFDFRINVDQKVDIELIRIPPLLIQPYVENAIIHAFAGLDNGGLITISVDRIDHQFLSIKVRDNGVGLNRNFHRTNQTDEKKKSLGTLINAERIETLNALYNNQFSVSVKNAPSGKGVWVEILIPINL